MGPTISLLPNLVCFQQHPSAPLPKSSSPLCATDFHTCTAGATDVRACERAPRQVTTAALQGDAGGPVPAFPAVVDGDDSRLGSGPR
jgi:hypothetical protein